MIFGTDTARFQPDGTYDPGAFEIVNIEDPQFAAKVARNAADGRPTDAYVWCYSNDRNREFFQWAIGEALKAGVSRLWLDYEEEGPEGNWRIGIWFEVCDAAGVQAGYYSNDWRVDHRPFLDRPYWYAGYPDPNDGQWKGGSPRASRPVQLWQFTSGGGLDRNVVIDEAWFANWVHGAVPAPPLTLPEEDNVPTLVSTNPGVDPAVIVWWNGGRQYKTAPLALDDARLKSGALGGVGLPGQLAIKPGGGAYLVGHDFLDALEVKEMPDAAAAPDVQAIVAGVLAGIGSPGPSGATPEQVAAVSAVADTLAGVGAELTTAADGLRAAFPAAS